MRKTKPRQMVQFTEPQLAWLQTESARLGVTLSELLRRIIDAARAEVARLRDAATEDIAALAAENEHLAAEVARLTAQEREAARILSFVSTAHASAWAAEAEAWLARCAPEVTHG